MGETILCIPADNQGEKLWIKDFQERDGRFFCQYRSTFNDIPFRETELFLADENKNLTICSDNGKALFRFSVQWMSNFNN